MHEMGLVRPLVGMVLEHAVSVNATEVKAVYLTIGNGRDVIEELMGGLFSHIVKGTVAENAKLVIERVPYIASCNQCGEQFEINSFKRSTWVCPRCGAERDYRLVSGLEFMVNRIEVIRGEILGSDENLSKRVASSA